MCDALCQLPSSETLRLTGVPDSAILVVSTTDWNGCRMIEYQPAMCIASVEEIREDPGRYQIFLYEESRHHVHSWNVSERYLEYLREDPAVPLCPVPGW